VAARIKALVKFLQSIQERAAVAAARAEEQQATGHKPRPTEAEGLRGC
jgi:hypothetical protein